MILIFTSINDASSNDVIRWLINKNDEFKRINIPIKLEDFIKLNLDFNKVTNIWIRRYSFNLFDLSGLSELEVSYTNEINKYLEYFIYEKSKSNCVLGSLKLTRYINKLKILEIAEKSKLMIPDFKIVTQKSDLWDIQNLESYITKPIHEISQLRYEKHLYTNYVNTLDEVVKRKSYMSANYICPSLIQKKIEKAFDLRIVFLNNNIWSMAIFSQNNSRTEVDFRNYSKILVCREAMIEIPINLKDCIRNFMKKINLNFGSLDFIVDKYGNYFFLEVNPVGQFGMVSKPYCINIEKQIANFLSN